MGVQVVRRSAEKKLSVRYAVIARKKAKDAANRTAINREQMIPVVIWLGTELPQPTSLGVRRRCEARREHL
jgi:hypothetical protein